MPPLSSHASNQSHTTWHQILSGKFLRAEERKCERIFFWRKMHSLSIKVFTDFNTGNTRRLPGRGSSGFAEIEECTRRQWLNCRDFAGNCRIVACASPRNGNGSGAGPSSSPSSSSSSFLSRSRTYALLKQQMEVAAKSEVSLSEKKLLILFVFSATKLRMTVLGT